MKTRTWVATALLLGLGTVLVLGFVWTRDPAAGVEAAPTRGKGAAPRPRQVDQRPLQTARRLAALAATAEEQALARQAFRLANHEVDLAFAEALRQAVEDAPPLSPEAKRRLDQRTQAEAAVAEDQQRIKQLTAQAAQAAGAARAALEGRIEVLRAKLELDQDELEEAAENFEQTGGDPQAAVRRLKAAHDAANLETLPAPAVKESGPVDGSVLARFRAWTAARGKSRQLAQAQEEARIKAQRLIQRQEAIARRLEEDKPGRNEVKAEVSEGATPTFASEALAILGRYTQDQRRLTSLLKRVQDERALGDVYGAWGALAAAQERTALHGLLKGLLGILAVLAAAFALTLAIDRLFHPKAEEDLREGTLRGVLKFAVQLLAALAALFMVLGMPSQTTTILGLAGAGLTVALKDFIVAFFGWFVLMGRNGIRVGDWVEIRGVGGEVVEIGLLRTVLLETGSWSDAGHPTGRRVAFVNSFAMEGHFFNFSTSGQWMWDELRVTLQPGQDPYPILDGVQRLVEQRTQANIAKAEQEWQGTAARYRVKSFSAAPGIQVQPTAFGIEIRVRYITRAFERHATRTELYEAVVALMHGKAAPPPGSGGAAPA